MVILSKDIYDRNVFKDAPCSILHLWSDKCTDGIKVFLFNVIIGTAKFFGPIYMLKLLISWKKISKQYVIWQILAYLRTLGYTLAFGGLFVGGLCVLANTSQHSYFNVMRAGFIAGLSILVESNENRNINTLLFFNQIVEGFMNILTHRNYITRSRWNETLTFMCISSVLMYLFKTTYLPPKFIHLWFYPTRSLLDYPEKLQAPCFHRSPCPDYAKNGAIEYFCIGYGIEFLRTTLPIVGKLIGKPKYLLEKVFHKKNLLFGLFIGSYVYLYRSITCHLLRRNGEEYPLQASVAGFIAGITYYFRPNIQILIIGITTILQLLYRKAQKKYRFPKYIPYSIILFCILNSTLLHFRFHLEDYCPMYTKNMLNAATNGLVNKIYTTLWVFINASDKSLLGV